MFLFPRVGYVIVLSKGIIQTFLAKNHPFHSKRTAFSWIFKSTKTPSFIHSKRLMAPITDLGSSPPWVGSVKPKYSQPSKAVGLFFVSIRFHIHPQLSVCSNKNRKAKCKFCWDQSKSWAKFGWHFVAQTDGVPYQSIDVQASFHLQNTLGLPHTGPQEVAGRNHGGWELGWVGSHETLTLDISFWKREGKMWHTKRSNAFNLLKVPIFQNVCVCVCFGVTSSQKYMAFWIFFVWNKILGDRPLRWFWSTLPWIHESTNPFKHWRLELRKMGLGATCCQKNNGKTKFLKLKAQDWKISIKYPTTATYYITYYQWQEASRPHDFALDAADLTC